MSSPFKLLVITENEAKDAISTSVLSYKYQDSAEIAYYELTGVDYVRVIRAYRPHKKES